MTKIMFTAEEFRSVVSVGVAASTDDVTPIIEAISISVNDGVVTAMATDRYRIARVKFTPEIADAVTGGDAHVLIGAKELAKFWATIKTEFLKSGTYVTLEIGESESGNSAYELEYLGSGIKISGVERGGNYPPLERLMEGYELGDCDGVPTLGILPQYLGDLAKIFHPRDSAKVNVKTTAWEFRFKRSESGKPGPVYITRGGSGNASVDYLVQPNLLTR